MKKKVGCLSLLLIGFAVCCAWAEELTLCAGEFAPFSFSRSGVPAGVATDIVKRVAADAGCGASIEILPWPEARALTKVRENTIIYAISRNGPDEKIFKWIGALAPMTYSVMALKSRNDIRINRLEELKKYKIGTCVDDIIEKWLVRKGFATTGFVRQSGSDAALKSYANLLNRRIDVWPVFDAVSYYIARQEADSNPFALLQRIYPLEELADELYLAAGAKTSDTVVSQLSHALEQFKQTGEYRELLDRWGIAIPSREATASILKLVYCFNNITRCAKIGYLAGDGVAARREASRYRKEIPEELFESHVRSFKNWCQEYLAMQKQVDAIIIGTNEGITGWDHDRALEFILANTAVPSGTVSDLLANYSLICLKDNGMILNMKIARAMGLKIPRSFFSQASRLIY